MLLSGLHPATDYHYRINAWDGVGYLAASSDFAFRTAVAGPATLLGDQTVQTERVTLAAGQAADSQDVAAQSGQGGWVRLCLDLVWGAPRARGSLDSSTAGHRG